MNLLNAAKFMSAITLLLSFSLSARAEPTDNTLSEMFDKLEVVLKQGPVSPGLGSYISCINDNYIHKAEKGKGTPEKQDLLNCIKNAESITVDECRLVEPASWWNWWPAEFNKVCVEKFGPKK